MLIYRIRNLINNKIYIGQGVTMFHVKKRWEAHRNGRGNKHLYNSINKYGIKYFVFEIIDLINTDNHDDLDALEILYIKAYNCMYPNGYNNTSGGDRNPRLYTKLCDETINKISKSQTGKTYSDETNKKKGRPGIPKSEEHKRKIGESNKISQLGKTPTDETRKKMSISHKGQKAWNKGLPALNKGISQIAWNVGLKRDEEYLYRNLTRDQKKYYLKLSISERRKYLGLYKRIGEI